MFQSYFHFFALTLGLLQNIAYAGGGAGPNPSPVPASTPFSPPISPPSPQENRFERLLKDQHPSFTWDCSHALKGDVTGDDIDDLICSGQNVAKKLIIGMIFGPLEIATLETSGKTAIYDGEVTQCPDAPCSLAFEEYNFFGDMEKTCRKDPKDEGCAELLAIEAYFKDLGKHYPHGITMNRGKLMPYHVIWDPVVKRFRAWTL